MLTDVVIGKYIVSNSEVHKLNPTFKILSLIIMLISTLFINSYEDIIMLFSYLFLSLVCSGIGLKVYLKEFLKFKVIFLIIVIINIITYNTIEIILSDIFALSLFTSSLVLYEIKFDSTSSSLRIKFVFKILQVILITSLRGGKALETINFLSGSNKISFSLKKLNNSMSYPQISPINENIVPVFIVTFSLPVLSLLLK